MSSSSSPARQETVAAAAAAKKAAATAPAGKSTEGVTDPAGEAVPETIQVAPDLEAVVDSAIAEKAQTEVAPTEERALSRRAAAEAKKAKELADKEALELAELEKATRPDSPPDQAEAVPPAGEATSASPEPESAAPAESVTSGIGGFLENPVIVEAMERRRAANAQLSGLPKRDALLRCDNFEDGLTVIGKVEVVDPEVGDGGQVLVWLPALAHHWPIDGSKINGSKWVHDPSRYPLRGEDEAFDARYRTKLELHAPEAIVPKPKFKAPRKPREGHAWARAIQPVGAHGFTIDGDAHKSWGPGEDHAIGEFNLNSLAEPGCFERL